MLIPGYKSFAGKAIRLPLRLIPPGLVVRVPRGPLKGLRWITDSSTHGCWLGTYEPEVVSCLLENLTGTFYDIGANAGFYTVLAAARGRNVIAFEPLPTNLRLLERHLSMNGLTATVSSSAVSDQDGEGPFWVGENGCIGRLGQGNLVVPTVRLDSLSYPPPQLMKIDVEGEEAKVLRGGLSVLTRYRPTIILATHGAEVEAECLHLLRSLDYRCTEIGSGSSYLCRS